MRMVHMPNDTMSRYGATVIRNGTWINSNSEHLNDTNANFFQTDIPCFPLTTLLLAANLPNIDLLALDLEVVELQVLKTVKWELHDIKVSVVFFTSCSLSDPKQEFVD